MGGNGGGKGSGRGGGKRVKSTNPPRICGCCLVRPIPEGLFRGVYLTRLCAQCYINNGIMRPAGNTKEQKEKLDEVGTKHQG